MSSAVAELENYLQSMLALKPPGVSGSKINSITSLCTANVQVRICTPYIWTLIYTFKKSLLTLCAQNESVLIQKIYTHFKKAPGTHKLGVLYVVDSVTRQWVEAARRAGQPAGSAAPDGTFAAGVNRVTELLPVLMTDIINNAPEDQKVRTRTTKQTNYRISHDVLHSPHTLSSILHRLISTLFTLNKQRREKKKKKRTEIRRNLCFVLCE